MRQDSIEIRAAAPAKRVTFGSMRLTSIMVIAVWLGIFGLAQADSIDTRTQQLAAGSDYKVRLSAAVWLAKRKDERSIAALADALIQDSEHTIRRIAAEALGKLVTRGTPRDVRERALTALEQAARKDPHTRVRKNAKQSFERLASLRAPDESATSRSTATLSSSVFINIGRPSLGKHRAPTGMDKALQTVVSQVLQQKTPGYQLGWESDDLPTKDDLERANTRAWFVGAAIAQLDIKKKGGSAEIRCSVSLRVNRWEGRGTKQRLTEGETASATGNGMATSANTEQGINSATRDCVLAVAEQVTAKQVVPFLKKRNP